MEFLNRLSFRAKLFMLCSFLSLVSAAVSVFAYVGFREVGSNYAEITDHVMPKLEAINMMFVEYRRVRIQLRTLGISGITKEQAEHTLQEVHAAIAAYEKADAEYRDMGFSDGQKELYDKLSQRWAEFKATGVQVLELEKSYMATGKQSDYQAMIKIFFEDCPTHARNYTEAMQALLNFHEESSKASVAEAKRDADDANITNALVTLIGIAGGMIVGFIFSNSVSKSISKVATGLSRTAVELTSASQSISTSSKDLSESSSVQASSLQETAAAMEQMSAMVTKNSDNAKSTAETSTASEKKALEGRQVMERMLAAMDEINHSNDDIAHQVNNSQEQMADFLRVIEEIGNKTKVINDIVFQTKLLSFNASVEAARAGESGKGFAVVAEEVGNLAQMSGNASKEIAELLESSIRRVQSVSEETRQKVETSMTKGRQNVASGRSIAEECGGVLNDIVTNVSKVALMAAEISSASQEQSVGLKQINEAMVQLDETTQRNSNTSQAASESAASLSVQADLMKDAVTELHETIGGKNARPAA